jgi:hypothetical protein
MHHFLQHTNFILIKPHIWLFCSHTNKSAEEVDDQAVAQYETRTTLNIVSAAFIELTVCEKLSCAKSIHENFSDDFTNSEESLAKYVR